MSFVTQGMIGLGYAPGWFLADSENCTRETRQIAADNEQVKTAQNGGKYMPMGAVYPANDATAVGIVFEDVDVTSGDMPGSVVTAGTIYADRLPQELSQNAKTALTALNIKVIDAAPTVTRPDWDEEQGGGEDQNGGPDQGSDPTFS